MELDINLKLAQNASGSACFSAVIYLNGAQIVNFVCDGGFHLSLRLY
jgi:hypothetical protein